MDDGKDQKVGNLGTSDPAASEEWVVKVCASTGRNDAGALESPKQHRRRERSPSVINAAGDIEISSESCLPELSSSHPIDSPRKRLPLKGASAKRIIGVISPPPPKGTGDGGTSSNSSEGTCGTFCNIM